MGSDRIIVVYTQGKDPETQGQIIKISSDAEFDRARTTIANKLSFASDVKLRTTQGEEITTIEGILQSLIIEVSSLTEIKEVPGPTPRAFVGNLYDILPDSPVAFRKLFAEYGPAIKMRLGRTTTVFTNDPEFAQIIMQENEYFTKHITGALEEVKAVVNQGLFTTDTDDMDWKLAHKLLMPAFSPRAIKAYTNEMGSVADSSSRIFSHFVETGEEIDIAQWTTKIALETIGRVGFGYDFHLFDDPYAASPRFVEAMVYTLNESLKRSRAAQFWKSLPTEANYKFESDKAYMRELVNEVIQARQNSPDAKNMTMDVLGYMLNARDSNGLGLSDEVIRDETSSMTMAWALYLIDKHPDVQQKVLQEIINVGINNDEHPTSEQVSQLKYLEMVIKETLRMNSPAQNIAKYCKKDCVVNGYILHKGLSLTVQLASLHKNAKYWDLPDAFDPDRFLPEREATRHQYAWLPFSTGARGCIGRVLAMQEIKIVLAKLLRKFVFKGMKDHVHYDTKGLTLRPDGMIMKIQLRETLPEPTADLSGLHTTPIEKKDVTSTEMSLDVPLPRLSVLFGSNTGTSQDYASRIASKARNIGFKNVTVSALDDWEVLQAGRFDPTEEELKLPPIVVVVTSTYNGEPPDNAVQFDKFISSASPQTMPFKGINFAVFGCGNKQWRTWQAFPTKVDAMFDKLGAERIFAMGSGDADADIDADYNEWTTQYFSYIYEHFGINNVGKQHDALSDPYGCLSQGVEVEFIPPSETSAYEIARKATNGEFNAQVTAIRELHNERSSKSAKHVEIQLPDGMTYQAGDHLEIFPQNDPVLVESVALGFGLVLDAIFEVKKADSPNLSTRSLAAVIKGPCTVRNALTYYADLTGRFPIEIASFPCGVVAPESLLIIQPLRATLGPPTRFLLAAFANHVKQEYPEVHKQLKQLALTDEPHQKEAYEEFLRTHRNILDVLHDYPMVTGLSLVEFLCAVQLITPRRYSISSSPLAYPTTAHLTIGIVKDQGLNGVIYPGLASGFIERSVPGTPLRAIVKSCKDSFRPPADPSVPTIMVGAGTGFAPFRGFLQDRQKQGFKSVAKGGQSKTILFFGCRGQDDFIYKDELEAFVADGTLDELFVTFSVQHQLQSQAFLLWELRGKGSFYVCGNAGKMAKDVKKTLTLIIQQMGGKTLDLAEQYMQFIAESGRYNEDVWG
ncbi:cytochrome P450 [Endogone sp. FLAS-F59071]|nr:cytochrome P450 [Endogone sp. FLAS-F59071]|eukprot:RUS19436.1 cytochrome P450 [Endogone sp. FLAS-F59071]